MERRVRYRRGLFEQAQKERRDGLGCSPFKPHRIVVQTEAQSFPGNYLQGQGIVRYVPSLDTSQTQTCYGFGPSGVVQWVVFEHHQRVEEFSALRLLFDFHKPYVLEGQES